MEKLECVNCGNPISNSEGSITKDDEVYCEDCMRKCGQCGEYHLTDDMYWVEDDYEYVCGDCIDRHYTLCSHCDEYHQTDYTYYIDSIDDRVCEDCYCDWYGSCEGCGWTAHIDDFHYSERHDCYYCEECDEENSESNDTFSYHSGEGREYYCGKYRYRIGIELEREDYDYKSSVDKYDLLHKTGWVMEEDGSLDYNCGFEAVSPVYPLKIGHLDEVFSVGLLKDLINADFSDSCGGHMTISDTKRTPDELIDDMAGYLPMIYALFPHRTTNHYCEPKGKETYKEGGRYALHKRGYDKGSGLEFRILDAPKDKDDLLDRARLLKYMLSHKASTVEDGLRELSDSDKLRKVIKRHLQRYDMSYEKFYSDLVRYARIIDNIILEIRPDELELDR